MSGLEFLLGLAVLVPVLWPSKKGKGLFARLKGWRAPRRPGPGLRPRPPAPREEAVRPAQPPAVRVGRSRRAYVKPGAGAAR